MKDKASRVSAENVVEVTLRRSVDCIWTFNLVKTVRLNSQSNVWQYARLKEVTVTCEKKKPRIMCLQKLAKLWTIIGEGFITRVLNMITVVSVPL